MAFELSGPAFTEGGAIPVKYTADGANVSPPLAWSDPPPDTRGYVLICDDPDAAMGTWLHWSVFCIPAEARELPEALPPDETLPGGIRQGLNDFHETGYGGPAPPPGPAHRYSFRLHALDTQLEVRPGAKLHELEEAMEEHVLAIAETVVTYGR